MRAAGVPVVPGETPADQSDDAHCGGGANASGCPVLVKPSAGGGGNGHAHRARADASARRRHPAARREAMAAFGDGTLYVERLIERPRHVEVQIFADDHGNVVHLFERECSIQRRHQKVIEESPSPGARRRRCGGAWAKRRSRCARGRLPERRHHRVPARRRRATTARFYFLEMNTRLQVEHPVTERSPASISCARSCASPPASRCRGRRTIADAARPRHRGAASTPRIPRSGFCRRRAALLLYREPRCPASASTAGVDRRRRGQRPLRSADREADRQRRNARASRGVARLRRCAATRFSASARTSRS